MKKINDISKWQDEADFRQMSTLSSGVILRAGPDSGTWEDRKFGEWRKQAESLNFPYGNYWYYLGNTPPKQQAILWSAIIEENHGSLGCWLDLEHSIVHENNTYLKWWDCVAYFKEYQPNAVLGIYTRASFFNDPRYNVPIKHAFRNLPLWVAHYDVDKPTLPKGWDDWLIWQHSENGDGHAHGVHSHRIDMNWYKGEVGETTTPKGTLTVKYGKNVVEYVKK